MKSFYHRPWRLIVSGFIMFFMAACAGEPVKVDLVQNHPANPEARETAFILPPNPFQDHGQMEIGAGPPGTQKKHLPSHQHQTAHEMDQMDKDSISAPESGVEKDDHQHSEHKQ